MRADLEPEEISIELLNYKYNLKGFFSRSAEITIDYRLVGSMSPKIIKNMEIRDMGLTFLLKDESRIELDIHLPDYFKTYARYIVALQGD
jgi:hypothetical protein